MVLMGVHPEAGSETHWSPPGVSATRSVAPLTVGSPTTVAALAFCFTLKAIFRLVGSPTLSFTSRILAGTS